MTAILISKLQMKLLVAHL